MSPTDVSKIFATYGKVHRFVQDPMRKQVVYVSTDTKFNFGKREVHYICIYFMYKYVFIVFTCILILCAISQRYTIVL